MTEPVEYCLLWLQWWPVCMSKSEWASWVQAVGSVLAIAGAFLLGERQVAAAHTLEDDKRRLDDFFRVEVFQQLFFEGRALCEAVITTTNEPFSNETLKKLSSQAHDLREEFLQAPIFEVANTGIARSAFHARGALKELKAEVETIIVGPGLIFGRQWAPEEQRRLRHLATHMRASTFVMGEEMCRFQNDKFRMPRSKGVS